MDSFDQLILKDSDKKKIKNWLTKKPNVCLFLTGPTGSGKTASTFALAKQFGYSVRELSCTSLRSVAILRKLIFGAVLNKNFLSANKNVLVVIENIDLLSTGDAKGLLNEFVKLIDKINKLDTHKNPIICTTTVVTKPLKKLANHSTHINLTTPNSMMLEQLGAHIVKSKGLGISSSSISLLPQFVIDFHGVVELLNRFFYMYGVEKVDVNTFYTFLKTVDIREQDVQLVKVVKKILTEPLDTSELLRMFETDPLLIPDSLFENGVKAIYKKPGEDKLERMGKMLEHLSKGIGISQEIGHGQLWSILEPYGLHSAVLPAKTVVGKKNGSGVFQIEKSRLFSIDQQICNNNSRINKLALQLGLNRSELITVVELITHNLLSKKGDIKKAAELVIKYGIDLDSSFRDILTIAKHKGKNYGKRFTKSLRGTLDKAVAELSTKSD